MTEQSLIVVGYDGSPASRAAVERGIQQTGPNGRLIVVHVYHVPADYIGAPYYESMLADASERARAVMDRLEDDVPGLAQVNYEPDAVVGSPAETICSVAEHRRADEIIIGSRGLGRMRALVGSVAHDVLHHATCPVTVIPERMLSKAAAPALAGSATR